MIQITPKAAAWLRKKGINQLTLHVKVAKVETCCSSQMVYADINFGAPDNPTDYLIENVGGIAVHYPSRIKLPLDRDVRIELRSILGIKSLQVRGLTRDEHLL